MCRDAVPWRVARARARGCGAAPPIVLALAFALLAPVVGCGERASAGTQEPAVAAAVGTVAAPARTASASAAAVPGGTASPEASGGAAPSGGAAVAPRLVVLYATCSLSRSHLGPYARDVDYTPALSRFAAQALVFDRHQAEAGQSGPAFASIVTGTGSATHGILRHPYFLDESLYTITEAFAGAGYDVHTWLDHLMASSALHYGQGVPPDHAHAGMLEADSPAFVAILDRLARDPSYKAFVLTTFTVTHSPYSGDRLDEFCAAYPGQCDIRRDVGRFERDRVTMQESFLPLAINHPQTLDRLGMTTSDVEHFAQSIELLYKAGVYRLDTMFGALVDAIDRRGLEAQSVIAFTSDHGEILYRDNALLLWTHGFQLSPEELGVALMIRGPGIRPGRFAGVTRAIDDFPTLAGLAGIDVALSGDAGVDLSDTIARGAAPPHLLAYSHSALYPGRIEDYPLLQSMLHGNRPADLWVAVRDGDRVFKLRRLDGAGRFQAVMFDLASDPEERQDLFDAANPEHQAMQARLEAYKARLVEGNERMQAKRLAEERAQRALKQLGYVE